MKIRRIADIRSLLSVSFAKGASMIGVVAVIFTAVSLVQIGGSALAASPSVPPTSIEVLDDSPPTPTIERSDKLSTAASQELAQQWTQMRPVPIEPSSLVNSTAVTDLLAGWTIDADGNTVLGSVPSVRAASASPQYIVAVENAEVLTDLRGRTSGGRSQGHRHLGRREQRADSAVRRDHCARVAESRRGARGRAERHCKALRHTKWCTLEPRSHRPGPATARLEIHATPDGSRRHRLCDRLWHPRHTG